MKTMMLTTAMMAALSLPTFAEETASPFLTETEATHVLASDMIGMRVYAAEQAYDADAADGVQDGWNDIGEIHDVVLSRDGTVEAVLVDIGGFLGIGERQVAVDMTSVRFVADDATADDADDFFLVIPAPRAVLEGAPAYGGADHQAAAATDAAPQADTAAEAAVARTPVARDGYDLTPTDAIEADALQGAVAYDAEDVRIGEVSEVLISPDGKVEHLVVDVGGFLGIGEKPVALALSDVDILRKADGSDLRVYVAMTKDQLDAMESRTN